MCQMAAAEELVFLSDEELEGAVAARTTKGVIESVDLATRSAVIGGYLYDFGRPDEQMPARVKMHNSDGGAYELLRPGMKVEIQYGDVGDVRLVVKVQQLSDRAVLGDL